MGKLVTNFDAVYSLLAALVEEGGCAIKKIANPPSGTGALQVCHTASFTSASLGTTPIWK
jgi:hypothetical protein